MFKAILKSIYFKIRNNTYIQHGIVGVLKLILYVISVYIIYEVLGLSLKYFFDLCLNMLHYNAQSVYISCYTMQINFLLISIKQTQFTKGCRLIEILTAQLPSICYFYYLHITCSVGHFSQTLHITTCLNNN